MLTNCSDTNDICSIFNNLLNVIFKKLHYNFNVNNVNFIDSKQISNEFNSFFLEKLILI